MTLPAYLFIDSAQLWQRCLRSLQQEPRLAIDLESNSLYAYRESVCLIQVSIPDQDYIIDPQAGLDLAFLGRILADPAVEKVFHAAEYDLILLKRNYDWDLIHLFDTMWATRILGYQRVGLASVLEDRYQIQLDKRFQKANWCKRPLDAEELAYAQCDTHYLLRLREDLRAELAEQDRLDEAEEIFAEQCQVRVPDISFDPESFWSIPGVRYLPPRGQAIARALNIFRDQEAQKRDRPLFKVFGNRTLVRLAEEAPGKLEDLATIPGMSGRQIRRYGRRLLQVIGQAGRRPPPRRPRNDQQRTPEEVILRYEHLHQWRKNRARRRGVESDVIVSREALWAMAHANPRSLDELAALKVLGPWRFKAYAAAILAELEAT